MAAPAAPVITSRLSSVGSYRLRWRSVAGAATYKVYRDAVATGQTYTDAVGGLNEAVVVCGPGDALTVTALNVGLEESAASNTITVGYMGGSSSFPPTPPRGPYNSNPFG